MNSAEGSQKKGAQMKKWFRLALFWPRLIAQMIAAMLRQMPAQIEKLTAENRALTARLELTENDLIKTRIELRRHQPGGFRIPKAELDKIKVHG
jgi:hypothetical protein